MDEQLQYTYFVDAGQGIIRRDSSLRATLILFPTDRFRFRRA
jgi:hypothetical protein